jgi:hypothetical protein
MKPLFIGFDVETVGDLTEYQLQPQRLMSGQAKLSSFACADENGLVVDRGLWPSVEQLRATLEHIAADPCAIAIGSNTVFDVAWLIALGLEDVVRRITWFDFQVMWRGLENNPDKQAKWGLKSAVRKFLPEYAGYEEEVHGDFGKVDQVLLEYNTVDSITTAKLGRMLWDQLDPAPARLVQVICQTIPAFSRAWIDGVHMSEPALAKWEQFCDETIAQSLKDTNLDEATIRSSKKLVEQMKAWGFDVTNAKGKDSVDKSVMSKYGNDPRIIPVRNYKRAADSKSRYINNSRKALAYWQLGSIHSQPKLWGAYTGRNTYSSKLDTPVIKDGQPVVNKKTGKVQKREVQIGVALHQWPKKREGKIARSCIIPPPGYLLTEYDFSNQESRIMADRSGDRTMLEVFNGGKDFHSMMGCKPAKLSYEEFYAWYKTGAKEAETFRQMGKVANLSLAYRTGAKTFQTMARTDYDVFLSFDEAALLCSLFKQTYPGVVEFWKTSVQRARYVGYAESIGGRRVYLKWTGDNRLDYANEQTAINFPVQASGADMKYLGIALSDAYAFPRGARYMMDLHDALYYIIPDDSQAMDTAREIKRILGSLPYTQVFGWTPRVPMPVDGKIGPSWGELKEIK